MITNTVKVVNEISKNPEGVTLQQLMRSLKTSASAVYTAVSRARKQGVNGVKVNIQNHNGKYFLKNMAGKPRRSSEGPIIEDIQSLPESLKRDYYEYDQKEIFYSMVKKAVIESYKLSQK